MLDLPSTFFIYRSAVDFRKSINGLALIVEQELGLSPFDRALYLFTNKKRDKIKALYWDKTGFALWYKRLEEERYKWPRHGENSLLEISEPQLRFLLKGFSIVGHQEKSFSLSG